VRSILTALCALVSSLVSVTTRAESARPNIIFVFTDDHASHAIGAYGSRINATPNIDRLAREGMLFRQSFCTNSICGPSRAVILTGKHSHLNGFRTNRDSFRGFQQTFPKLLQRVGYQTAIVGKWHLVSDPTGFDFWEVLIGQGPYYNPPMRTPRGTKRYTGYTTDVITDVAIDWLAKKRDPERPFLLMYQHKAPHREWQPGPKHYALYADASIPEPPTLFDDWEGRTSAAKEQTMSIARHLSPLDLKLQPPGGLTKEQLAAWHGAYDAENERFHAASPIGPDLVRWKYQRYIKDYLRTIASVDDNLGRLLAYLDSSGLAENTVVVYSSDQGFYLGDHGWYDKRWMYEESLRMPLIVRWPGVVRPGSVDDEHLVQNLDYASTFLELAQAPIPEDLQGRSLVPLLRGEKPTDWRRSIYYHYYEYPEPHRVRPHYGVRTLRHKLIHYYDIGERELFDLEKDPDELRSVHEDPGYADTLAELQAELKRIQRESLDLEPNLDAVELEQRELRERARRVRFERVLQIDDAAALDAPSGPAGLDPSAKPIAVGAWCRPRGLNGVIVAQGGESQGFALYVENGRPVFSVRGHGALRTVRARDPIALGEFALVVGIIRAGGRLVLFVDDRLVAAAPGLIIPERPADGLSLGRDSGSRVGPYETDAPFLGEIRDLRIHWGTFSPSAVADWAGRPPSE
jgi:arylsulfatase A-like enzyme